MTIDSVAILLAGGAAYTIRNMFVNLPVMSPADAALLILASCVVTITIALVSGIYRSACRIPLSDQSRDGARAYLYSAATIVCGTYFVLGERFAPRFTVIFLVLIPVFYSLRRILSPKRHPVHGKEGIRKTQLDDRELERNRSTALRSATWRISKRRACTRTTTICAKKSGQG